MTYPGVHGEKQPQLRQLSLDPLDLIWRERLGDGDLMEVLNFTEEAENRLRRFNEVNEHRLKAIATEIVEGILWVILGEGTLGNSHYVHPPLLLVTDLIGVGRVRIKINDYIMHWDFSQNPPLWTQTFRRQIYYITQKSQILMCRGVIGCLLMIYLSPRRNFYNHQER